MLVGTTRRVLERDVSVAKDSIVVGLASSKRYKNSCASLRIITYHISLFFGCRRD